MMDLLDLGTPAILIDQSIVRANITAMQDMATSAGIQLRPHVKTHKSVTVGQWQLDAGAVGITVAKVGEAEVFASHGFTDIRIAYPVSTLTVQRVLKLMGKTNLSIVVDNETVATRWSDLMLASKRQLDVLVKVDVGFHRCGIDPTKTDAASFLGRIAALPGLRLQGLLSHAGHSYESESRQEIAKIAKEEARTLGQIAEDAENMGTKIHELSVGATPTAQFSLLERVLTELRPGNYVFYDLTQVALGAANIAQCGLSIWTTVISQPEQNRLVLDAGSKTLSSDRARGKHARPGFGAISSASMENNIDNSLIVERLSEEHAVVSVIDGKSNLAPGDRVRLIPNHACVAVNLADKLHLIDGTTVVSSIAVEGRGENT
jgi:D-serine deaminase-like pyridoxal phosphate-dependent protein